MNSKSYAVVKIILSILLIILIQMNIDMNVLPHESFYSKDRVTDVFLFAVIYCSFSIWEKGKNKYKRWSLIIASFIAVFYVFGYNIERYLDIFTRYNHNWIMGKLFLKWIGCWYAFSTLLLLSYERLDKLKRWNINKKIAGISKFVRYLLLTLIFVICWTFSLINNFPGVIYADSWNQIYQALGIENFTNHHPMIHTLFLKICFIMGGDIKKGIILYTIISFFGIIFILSGIINLMIEENFDLRMIIISCFLYLFFPSIQMFAITITKDSWFAAFVGIFLLELYIVLINKKWGGHTAALAVAATGVGIFRKNGIYLLIFTVVYMSIYMCICKKKRIKKSLIICMFAIFLNMSIEKGILYFSTIDQGSPREMLSLPIQQMARIEKNVKVLNSELKKEIDSFFKDGIDLGEKYYPLISDNAKDCFDEKKYYGREKEFLILSIRLFCKYPEESLEAFMCNSFGYWYPIAVNWFYAENCNKQLNIGKIVEQHEYPWSVEYIYFNEFKNITGLASFLSIGMIFWIYMIIGGYLAANKKYEKLTLIIPMGALWITSVASPVYNELRYVLSIYIVLPVIGQLVITDLNDINGDLSKEEI